MKARDLAMYHQEADQRNRFRVYCPRMVDHSEWLRVPRPSCHWSGHVMKTVGEALPLHLPEYPLRSAKSKQTPETQDQQADAILHRTTPFPFHPIVGFFALTLLGKP